MWAICSFVDNNIMRVRLAGEVICCIFGTDKEAYDFMLKYEIRGRVEQISIQKA
ncbi:hypothetical protein PQB73_gp049 [Cronobacter phage LPCS28]|jgi:hypothetical protein|uniref:Uncharacterized protein n=1 Tax=Cronobacter phage LPCS28 TaxID=2924885 RepID=A0AAE9K690_9CAUD|nr:hypothetical protein PQB73_gp049 [Cronobacter phage LPCS28]UNY47164.1 hypothetical protein EHEKIMEA_00282 [Cronobacter phage LPCS28]